VFRRIPAGSGHQENGYSRPQNKGTKDKRAGQRISVPAVSGTQVAQTGDSDEQEREEEYGKEEHISRGGFQRIFGSDRRH
jgi:hypothetical protein